MSKKTKNTCFKITNGVADCKFVKYCEERHHKACFHPNKSMREGTERVEMGRGVYCYPHVFDTCDCNGYEPVSENLIKGMYETIIKLINRNYARN